MTFDEAYTIFWDAYWRSYYLSVYGKETNPYDGIPLFKDTEHLQSDREKHT